MGNALVNFSRYLGRETTAIPQVTSLPRVVNTKHATFIIPATSPYYNNPERLVEQYATTQKPKPSFKHAPQAPSIAMDLDQPTFTKNNNNPFDGLEVEPLPSLSKPKQSSSSSSHPHIPKSLPKVNKGTQTPQSRTTVERAIQVHVKPLMKDIQIQTDDIHSKEDEIAKIAKFREIALLKHHTRVANITSLNSPPPLLPTPTPTHKPTPPSSSPSTSYANTLKRPHISIQTNINPKKLLTKLKHHHKMPPPQT